MNKPSEIEQLLLAGLPLRKEFWKKTKRAERREIVREAYRQEKVTCGKRLTLQELWQEANEVLSRA